MTGVGNETLGLKQQATLTYSWRVGGLRLEFRVFDVPTLLYLIIWIVLMLSAWERLASPWFYLAFHLLFITNIFLFAAYPVQHPLAGFFRQFYLVLYVPLFFTALHYLIPAVHPRTIDDWLIRWDLILLGDHATVLTEKITYPLLTEYLQWCYTSFYFLPAVVAGVLYSRKQFRHLDYFITLIAMGFYLSYLGYVIFPALGPRFFLAHLQQIPLKGVWAFDAIQNTLNSLENIQWDAFPSGHTAIVLVLFYYTFRYHRKLFQWIFPFGAPLIFSTVYLRYHYFVDVVAGGLLALVTIRITNLLIRRLFPDWCPATDTHHGGAGP